VRRGDVESELLDESRQARCLTLGKLQHEPGQGRRVDDGVLERALETATDEPRVESIVAVLDQHGAVSETQESTARVAKLRCADEHRAVDVMAPVGVGVDGRLAIDQGVEEGKRAVEPEPLGADLEDQERGVPGGLDVEGHELRIVKLRRRPDLRRVDRDLFPGHRLHGPARLQEERLGAHLESASARRAQSISSLVNPRRSSTAAP
jgi:hypothetical protein